MEQVKMFWTYLRQQISESSPERVLNAIINALIISRLPYNVKQTIIRNRRTYEEQHGDQVCTDNLFEMLNNIIHDLELTQGNNTKPLRKKGETPKGDERDDLTHKKRSYVIKKGGDNNKNKHCALCKSKEHGTRSHRFPIHGEIALERVKGALKSNKLCQRCAQPLKDDPTCVKGVCENIKRPCYYCNSTQHPNILCDAPRVDGRAPQHGRPNTENDHSTFRPNQD